MKLKELRIDTQNVIFGRLSFLHMKIPEDWFVSPIPGGTDVEAWVETDNDRWVSSGYTRLVMTDYDSTFRYTLYIKVSRNLRDVNIGEKVRKYRINAEHKGVMRGDHHEIAYVAYQKRRKKHLFYGPETIESTVKFFVGSNIGKRILSIEISGVDEKVDTMLKRLFPVISTISCE